MTTEQRTRAIAWFESRAKRVTMPGAAEMCGFAVEALNAQRWIPVSERFPEVKQSVLCIDDEGTPHVAKNWVDWEDGSISFEVSDLNRWIKCAHWMPLPDPPKMDGEV